MRIYCCQCEKEIFVPITKGSEIYPHRPDLADLNFYKCPHCGNYVGCHKGTNRPLGVIPTPAIRQARKIIHSYIDPIYKSGKMTRTTLYRTISKKLGYTYHTGETKSVSECVKIMNIAKEIKENLEQSLTTK